MAIRVDRKTFEKLSGEKLPAMAKVRKQHVTGEMNETESRFERDILEPRRLTGEVLTWWFESFKVRVGTDTCWLTVDFVVVQSDGELLMIDVKGGGGGEDDALVKIKAAAAQYPQFHWQWWTYKGGSWSCRRFGD